MATASAYSKDARPRRRNNEQMVQNVLLLWLDNNINDDSSDCRNTLTQLRRAVNSIYTFTDSVDCVKFIEEITDNKACVIISGALGQHVVPHIHDRSQVDSIFIFCGNKTYHKQWAKDWSKIKGVFTDITRICDALKTSAQQCEQNAISISFMATSGEQSKKKLDQLDPTYMYTTIMKEILLTIDFEPKHIREFIQHCRDLFSENPFELKNIDKLQKQYHNRTPIWWYTYQCFLYPMLNCCLRLLDVDIITKMGFFIKDLHHHIERLHREQFSEQHADYTFTVYRGQGLSKTDFDEMKKTKGGLMSFNNFLSTSKDRSVSLDFARRALPDPEMVGILFVMTISPSKSTTPFASIIDVGYYGAEEDEVLFGMNTVFRIGEIKVISEHHRLIQVQLDLSDNSDKDLCALTNRIREETFPHEQGWDRLGQLLMQMGQFKKAQEVYEIILEQTSDENEKSYIYERLANAKRLQRDYKEALLLYEQSLEIRQRILPKNSFHLGYSHNAIGAVHHETNNYSKALKSYEKALEIWEQSLTPNHPATGTCHRNIGSLHCQMKDYAKAQLSYNKALEIFQESLPPNHPDLAASYLAIGNVHSATGDCQKALSHFEKALAIQQRSLVPTHPDLALTNSNIGLAYENMNQYSKAHPYFERAVNIAQHSLPEDHPLLQTYRKNLDRIKSKM